MGLSRSLHGRPLRTLLITLTGFVALSAVALVQSPNASAADGDPLLTTIGGPKDAADLDVMTFNLRSAELGVNDYLRRRSATLDMVRNEQPDLIGTQEGVKMAAG